MSGDDRESLTEVRHVLFSRGFWKLLSILAVCFGTASPTAVFCYTWITGKIALLNTTSTDLGVTELHVKNLTDWQKERDRQYRIGIAAARVQLSQTQRSLIEYVAGARRMNVKLVLQDYDGNIRLQLWLSQSPECPLEPKRCATPAEAAQQALAIHTR